jgi:hypothetical protein
METLEIFVDGRGGYFPQLSSEEPQRDMMTVTPHNRHWCQPDYGTTCLVTALRAEAGLECKTTFGYLEGGFESRSGLYFANLYMVDWALAWALQGVSSAIALRERLATEMLASVDENDSFGQYNNTDVHRPGDTGPSIARHGGRKRTPGAHAPGGTHNAGWPLGRVHTILFRRDDPTRALPGWIVRQAHARGEARAPGPRAPSAPSLCTSTSTI